MNKKIGCLLLACLMLLPAITFHGPKAAAASYMSNKTEIPVNLEVSGAEALCQTQDGYVWIAQYSGLTRYDSKEFITYKDFEFDGQKYSVINVRALAAKGNTLYAATSELVFVYEDYHFEPLPLDPCIVVDLTLDDSQNLLYISTQDRGGIIYDIQSGTTSVIPGTEGKSVHDIAPGAESGSFYYQVDEGVYDHTGAEILKSPRLLEIYSYGSTLFMAEDSGVIHRYDMESGSMLDDLIVPDQVNQMLYSGSGAYITSASS